MSTLGDMGERAIIEELLVPRYGANGASFGDDCAAIAIRESSRYQVVTTDPCPVPAASLLGFSDYYYWGWLLATINLSDIAAAGARAEGMLTSLILPRTFPISDFLRILDGIDGSLRLAECDVIGGNLKEGKDVALSATAVASSDGMPMSRRGAKPGDLIVALGGFGQFWAGFLARSRDLDIDAGDASSLLDTVLTPKPKVSLGQVIRREGLATACLDNSDGLYPSLAALCSASEVGVHLSLDEWQFSREVAEVARHLSVEPHRLALGWGDWQLVVAVNPGRLEELVDAASEAGESVHVIGDMRPGSEVWARFDNSEGGLMRLDSQRFAHDSWFETGIDAYISALLESPLLVS